MQTKQTNTLAAAVAAAVTPATQAKPDKLAQARMRMAEARADAFVLAYLGLADAEAEARAQEGNAWSHYVEACGYGMQPDDVAKRLYAAIKAADRTAQEEASGKAIPEGEYVESDASKETRRGASNRCKNYKRRVAILLAHKVALLGPDGDMAPACVVQFKGETFEGALGSVAQRLLKAGAETRAPRQTTGPQTEDGEEGTTDGKVDHKVVSGADVPLDAPLIERVCSWLASDTPEGEAARSANEDAITRAAELIALKRLNAQAIREAQAKARAERKARAESKARASAAQVVVEAAQSAAAVQ